MNRPNPKNQDPGFFNFKKNKSALIFLVLIIALFVFLFMYQGMGTSTEISYSQFLEYLKQDHISSVKIIDHSRIEGAISRSNSGEMREFWTRIPYTDDQLLQLLKEKGIKIQGEISGPHPFQIFLEILPWLILPVFMIFMFRQLQGGGNKAFSFGKSRAIKYNNNGTKVTFADVAGQTEAKFELQEVVEFLKNPKKFHDIGAKIPKGVLLVGLPGTGKTLLARAIAGEADVSFFHMSGSDFVEMFVGVGASRVRDLFAQGRKNAPCIIFIDELDAVGRTRGAGYGGGHDEREQTLNQMLVEMDGFDNASGVIVVAATNRPDVLDPALLRPGRFDRQVVVDMPDVQERREILKIHAKKIQLEKDVDFEKLAKATPGTSGADLANMVNEAALHAASHNHKIVSMDDFEEARDKMLLGVARKSRVISSTEKEMTAYHEAGHALLHFYLENADPLHKVTVIPRGRALGAAISLPDEDKYSRDSDWLLDRIKIAFGGYVSEMLKYKRTTTGTQNDISQATDIARKMVCKWGMSPKLGPVAFGKEEEPIFLGKEIARHEDYSEETARMIDEEIRTILKNCQKEVENLLSTHQKELDLLATTLIEKETMDEFQIKELLGMEKTAKEELSQQLRQGK